MTAISEALSVKSPPTSAWRHRSLPRRSPVAPLGAAATILTAARGGTSPTSDHRLPPQPSSCRVPRSPKFLLSLTPLITSTLSHSLLYLPIDYFCSYTNPDFLRSVRDTISERGARVLRTFHTTPAHLPLQSALEAARLSPGSDIYVTATCLLMALQDS